jgi:ribosomal protein L29
LIQHCLDGRIEHVIEQLASATDEGLLAELRELEVELARVRFRQLAVLA